VNRFPSTCRWIALLATSVLFACGRAPSLQEPNLHSLSGRVRLTGTTIDANGKVGATRVVDDADGVLVELLSGHDVIARAQTIHGVYTFPGLAPGAYQTQAFVSANVWDKSAVFTIVKTDLAAGDTLRLTSLGDLYPVPNPVVTESTIYFELPDSMMVDVRANVLYKGGRYRETPGSTRLGGFEAHVIEPDGTLLRGGTAAALTGVTLDAGTDQRAQLIFR
jgi:hypothetical protein